MFINSPSVNSLIKEGNVFIYMLMYLYFFCKNSVLALFLVSVLNKICVFINSLAVIFHCYKTYFIGWWC